MADLDDLLSEEIGRAAAEAAHPPAFEVVQARGRRRRRNRLVGVTGGLTAAAVLAVAVTQLPTGDRADGPLTPNQSTSQSTSQSPTGTAPATEAPPTARPGPTPEEILDAPDASPYLVVSAPGNQDVRAAVWSRCEDPCRRREAALVVTTDGFRTRVVLPVGRNQTPNLSPLGPDSFLYDAGHGKSVLFADGSLAPLEVDRAESPVRPGEVLTRGYLNPDRWLAVDPATSRAHQVATPAGTWDLTLAEDGTLRGLARGADRWRPAFVVSTDGGQTWDSTLLEGGSENSLFQTVPGADPETLAVLGGGDGATFLPLSEVHRSLDGGATWERFDYGRDPMWYVGGSAVLPDGRLLVDIDAWSDWQVGNTTAEPMGLYLSDGTDWADLRPVELGPPFDALDLHRRTLDTLAFEVTDGEVAILGWLPPEDGHPAEVYRSTDAGTTWTPWRAR